jgi:diaminopimelate epimerase
MHGAGNDFIVVDDRSAAFPSGDPACISRLCSRRRGIGSEGLILIQASEAGDFRMRFFNPDGGEAELCGNGLRCAARFACANGLSGAVARVETMAGVLETEVLAETVRIQMPPPRDLLLDQVLNTPSGLVRYGFVNTGVPHAVISVPDLDSCDVAGLGRSVREHPVFAPAGTNVDFITLAGPNALRIRTYERGVEAESGACGTGIVAAALVAARPGGVECPVAVTTAGGDVLTVRFDVLDGQPASVTLEGPAETVFDGQLVYGEKT